MSTLNFDPIESPDEAPLELATVPCSARPPLFDDADDLLDTRVTGLPPDTAQRRFAAIVVTGFLLVLLAGIARVALDQAAPPPPGVIEPMASESYRASQRADVSVARYEFERARALH